ncbi:hypothetical protein B0T20DRAFT_381171 [Sordaria brevicollis]|uniref:Uncharacterized protein n=1 Tax=Sordaria brevicollis TaxID=83679 RepID=A0AAE0PAV1_SORBR|nr:hypothetical protein B0T20DRAFT_381171 [Sordaria brevicollis]
MNRQVVTSTLSRRGVASTLLNTTSRPFSTTTRCAAEDDDKKSAPAASPRAVSPSRQKSDAAVGKLTQLRGSFTSLTSDNSFQKAPPAGAYDARRLAAAPAKRGDGPATPLGGPKIINVRSLKGSLGSGGAGGLGRGRFAGSAGGSGNIPGAVSPGAAFRPRFAPGGPAGASARPSRFGSPGAPTGAAGAPGGGGRRTGFGGGFGGGRDGKKPMKTPDNYFEPPTKEELAYVSTLEQGVVTEYVPKLNPDLLLGYGPPVATDVSLGKVETAIRTMRILGGGQPFNPESGVTSDPTAVKHRYVHEKKPVFFSSVEEKEWVKDSLDKFALAKGPEKKTKKMILETSVLGKYEAPQFVEKITDTVKLVERYQKGTFSYAPSDAEKFMGKLNQLLAAGQPKGAVQAAKKA